MFRICKRKRHQYADLVARRRYVASHPYAATIVVAADMHGTGSSPQFLRIFSGVHIFNIKSNS